MSGTEAAADFDVIILGAGLSGIGAARWLKTRLPGKSFAILEEKPRIGGTWDLFRYPGIRSDSDMHTMGYAFKPWTEPKAIADGPSILSYVQETAEEEGLLPHLRFENRVRSAAWSTKAGRWTLEVEEKGAPKTLTARFVFACTGYYDHHRGHLPEWPGYDAFQGQLVHPQFWPEDLDVAGKKVVLIGSGATAVTLTPALAETAAHVTQVQRSPTYVVSRPGEDALANGLRRWLPDRLAYGLTRWRTILAGRMRRRRFAADLPAAKRLLIGGVAKALGDKVDWRTHFVPDYWPGQQRICAVPDDDFFESLKSGRCSIVTGKIAGFTPTGLLMEDGTELEADIIVTATGLELTFMGGMSLEVDDQPIDPAKLLIFKGFMYSNVPNLIYFKGYTNASWTLKVDLVAEYACRLLDWMDRRRLTMVTPRATQSDFAHQGRALKFNAGYILRTAHLLPKHGAAFPWIHEQDYLWDRKTLKRGRIDDGTLDFSERPVILPPAQAAGAAKAAGKASGGPAKLAAE